MNDIQRECYRCLKKYHRAYLSKHPKGLVTFHLKTILLQTIEETGSDVWTESNQAGCLMKLLNNLLKALKQKHLSHFFVKSYNMFCIDYIENPEVLESLASKVEQIMQNPLQFAQELIIQTENSQDQRKFQEERDVPSHSEGNSPFTWQRYEDMKVSFLAVGNELIDIAFNEQGSVRPLKLLDPLETSLVQDIREIQKQVPFTCEEFSEMFELTSTAVYLKLFLSTESIMRQRVLYGVQSALKIIKYILNHHDDETGTVEAVSLMLDPAAKDAFDLSDIIPAGGGTQLARMLTGNCTPESRSDKPHVDMNEIPLD